MSGTRKLPVRLMLRAEGEWWNAYVGPAVGRVGEKTLLGSMRLTIATRDPLLRQAFIDLMSDALARFIGDLTGITPVMGKPETAPESERSGNA